MSAAPIDILVTWFESLAPEIKTDLAVIVSSSLPSDLLGRDEDGEPRGHLLPDQLLPSIRRWAEGMPSRQFGTVLALAAIIDAFLERRDSPSDWAEGRALWEHMRDTRPSMKELAEQHLAELPMRSRRWIEVAKEWKQLRSGALSPREVHEWMSAQRPTF